GRAVGLGARAALVDGAAGRLEQEETCRRLEVVEAAAEGAAGERLVVLRGVVAEQGDLEALLARRGGVAGAGVAAVAGEQRHDVGGEADGLLGGALDLDGDAERRLAVADGDGGR